MIQSLYMERDAFSEQLDILSNLQWDNTPGEVIDSTMQAFITQPTRFAEYLVSTITNKQTEYYEQAKGVLQFLVYRHPEIFIIIYTHIKCFFGDCKEAISLIDVYNLFVVEA
jgi:hypothetical protein